MNKGVVTKSEIIIKNCLWDWDTPTTYQKNVSVDAFLCLCGNSTGFVEVSKKKAGAFWFPAHTIGIKPSKFSNKNPTEEVGRHKNLTTGWLICLNHQQQCYI